MFRSSATCGRAKKVPPLSFLIPPSSPLTCRTEYQWVAGGEELFLETGLLAPVKKEDSSEASLLSPADTDDLISPISSVSAGSLQFDGLLQMPPEPDSPGPRGRSSSLPGLHRRYIPSPLAPRPLSSFDAPPFSAKTQSVPSSSSSYYHESPIASPLVITPPPAVNRLISINLFGEGLQAYAIPLQSYYSPTAPRLLIKVKIRLPAIDDIQGSPTLHGIHASISLARSWTLSATCTTDVYVASVHHSRVTSPLQPPVIDLSTGESTANLPESELTRCRWFDASMSPPLFSNRSFAFMLFFSRYTNHHIPAHHDG